MVVGGWSGGGFLTNWTVARTNRFKAAVSCAGISNWVSLQGTSDGAGGRRIPGSPGPVPQPGSLDGDDLAGALVAAELAELPVLDLLGQDLQAAVGDPDEQAWAELAAITRAEVSQATGMLVAQLDIGPAEALVRLRAHAYATGRSATEVARDILDHGLRLECY